jgi:hypothetical protein
MKFLAILAAAMAMLVAFSNAGAQTPQAEAATPASIRSAPANPDADVPPALRRPLRDASSGPILLRYQAMQKLKRRFDEADTDGNGALNRDEARKAGLGFIDKNFDHIDTAQRGNVNFEDLKAWIIQRREEARSR